jgi:pimeloyl-ACP methyl ester carboxylesterase
VGKAEYRLTTELYVETIRAFCAALGLKRPVAMGCSIGGRIILQLAHAHGPEFRALIGIESADFQQPWYDTNWLHRSDVHGGEVCAALVSGLIAPQSPGEHRHETLWQYMQAAPGIQRGPLFLPGGCRRKAGWTGSGPPSALYLFTGEYDFPASRRTPCAPRKQSPG